MLPADEVKRVGREARRKDGRMRRRRRHTTTQRDTKTELRAAKEGSKRRQKEEVKREVRERGFRSSNLPDLYVFSLSLSPHSRIYRLRAGRPRARSSARTSAAKGDDGSGRRGSESESDARNGAKNHECDEDDRGSESARTRRSLSTSANRAMPFTRVSQSSNSAGITRLLSGGKKK